MSKIAGIYKITNKENGKVYIGESEDIPRRWTEHITELEHGEHGNYILQKDFEKEGLKSFDFEILEQLPTSDNSNNTKIKLALLCRENVYIKYYHSIENGYNVENTLSKILNKERSIWGAQIKINDTRDYGTIKTFIQNNPNILNLDYQLSGELTMLKEKKSKKQLKQIPIKSYKALDNLSKELQYSSFTEIYNAIKKEKDISNYASIGIVKYILSIKGYLYYDVIGCAYQATKDSINKGIIIHGDEVNKKTYKNFKVLFHSDMYEIIEHIMINCLDFIDKVEIIEHINNKGFTYYSVSDYLLTSISK